MSVAEWQKRLESTFMANGAVGGRLLPVMELERGYGEEIAHRLQGHFVLLDSFSGFFVETMECLRAWINQHGWQADRPQYVFGLMAHVASFERLRGTEILLMHGYPLVGYARLRDTKEQIACVAAVMNGFTTFRRLAGLSGPERDVANLTEAEYRQIRSRRIAEEHRVLQLTFGPKSGLPEATLKALDEWERMFNEETHGSRLTQAHIMRRLQSGAPLIGPQYEELLAATYSNRCTETSWMMLRTLPVLQLEQRAFGEEWAARWHVLDDSFRQAVLGLEKLGKPIASAIVTLLDTKFAFSPDCFYKEHPPRASRG